MRSSAARRLGLRLSAGLSIRVRLTLAFSGVMTLVMLLVGVTLYWRLAESFDRTLQAELEARFEQLATAVAVGAELSPPGTSVSAGSGELVQILGADGRVLDAGPGPRGSLLSPQQLSEARGTRLLLPETAVSGNDDPFRLLAGPVKSGERVLVVARSTEEHSESQEALVAQLALGGPLVLLASSFLAYLLAAAALRPVEVMRRRAETLGTRNGTLPVPDGDDELARLGRTLNSMLLKVQESLTRERAFLADASHELRSPLASLRLEVDLALSRARSPEELQHSLEAVRREVERLSALADDLLLLARADQGELALDPSGLDAGALLAGVAARFESRAALEGRSLRVEAPGNLSLRADKRRLEQALANLVENSLTHGAGDITMRATAPAEGGVIELHVLDQGQGFAPEILPRAFERFMRARRSSHSEGAGLGLAIVRAVALAHGGRALVVNGVPAGADVYLSLPAHAGPA